MAEQTTCRAPIARYGLYLWLAGLALLPVIWLLADPFTAAACRRLDSHPTLGPFLVWIAPLGKFETQLGLLLVAWLVAWRWIGWKRTWRGFVLMLLCLLITGAAVNVAKIAVWRPRPRYEHVGPLPRTWDTCTSSYRMSFPSGDAAALFALATAALCVAPRASLPLFALGLLIGASRISLGAHHFADIWGGLLVGTGVSALACRWWCRGEQAALSRAPADSQPQSPCQDRGGSG